MAIRLYTNEGFSHEGERLMAVDCADATEILEKMFEMSCAGKTVTLIRDDGDGTINYMLTLRNKEDYRKYIASIFAELTANFKISIP